MSAYELYRCIREDGTSKDWALRINPDGTITTRWGRTGRKLINIQTRNVDSEILKRSKAKKGYGWVVEGGDVFAPCYKQQAPRRPRAP